MTKDKKRKGGAKAGGYPKERKKKSMIIIKKYQFCTVVKKLLNSLDAWPTIVILNGFYSRSPQLAVASCLQVVSHTVILEYFNIKE